MKKLKYAICVAVASILFSADVTAEMPYIYSPLPDEEFTRLVVPTRPPASVIVDTLAQKEIPSGRPKVKQIQIAITESQPRARQFNSTGGTSTGWTHDPEVSWYGPGFYSKRTACGQKYTRQIMGVAHRTLPCGTMVTFRYNGRTARVPVIDRGPYVAGRQWDLSGGLCVYLDHCFTGPIDFRIG